MASAPPTLSRLATDGQEYPPGLIPPGHAHRLNSLIGEVVVALGFANVEEVEAAAEASKDDVRTTGQILVDAGVIRPDQLARALAEKFGVDFIDITTFEVDRRAIELIEPSTAKRYRAVPVGWMPDGTVVLAMADPANVLTLDEVAMVTGMKMRPAALSFDDILTLLSHRGMSRAHVQRPESVQAPEQVIVLTEGPAADEPVVKMVQELITRGVELGASDIHLDPTGDGDMRVAYRVDGVLADDPPISRLMASSVVSRIKIMADLNIAQRRMPQDGRMRVTISQREVDVRVATLPLIGGEGVVMRVLDASAVIRDLRTLGMPERECERFEIAVGKPHGAVLVTGPTGSGKSTTLYSGLGVINNGRRSIFTIEDPVESPLHGIKQMQVAPKSGVTFAVGLRAILRADPDVIMVGEIRDGETAEIAIQAALTGHLMLSTLHTRDAPSALTRLIDMGIETFMVSAAIDCIVAQRLARSLCRHCKQTAKVTDDALAKLGLRGSELFEPVGCARCGGTGYRGRLGLYEVLEVNEEVRNLVLERVGTSTLAAAAVRGGMRTMREDGIEKVKRGLTSLAEVGRVTAAG